MKFALTSILLACLIAAHVFAQEPPGPGRGFRRFGMGGPATNTMLLGMAEVQKELALSDAQKKQLTDLMAEQQAQQQAARSGFNLEELQNLSEEERQQRFDAVRKKTAEISENNEGLLAQILDAKQLERLGQLRIQRDGTSALIRPEVAKPLGLSDEQIDEIRKLQESAQPQFGFGPPDFARIEEQRKKAEADVVALLNDDQKSKWSAMKGAEFKFPAIRMRMGPGQPARKIVKQFDKDGDKRLNREERLAARQSIKAERSAGGGPGFGPGGGFGPPGGGPFGRRNQEPPKPGPHVEPADAKSYPDAKLYDAQVLRTIFLEFADSDWEAELADFYRTDVELPATLTVDGKHYPNVGVNFRGMSSYFTVGAGFKRSLNVSLDAVDSKQRLYGYKTLNLLNSHEDPSFLHTVLYSHIARQHIPAPQANFVKLVINGESWGIYVNAQQFDKEFIKESFPSSQGVRWKVPGNPGADGGLRYLGDNIEDYKQRFEMKTNDGDKAWRDLINLCRILNETPLDQLEAALSPILDIDGVLKFLALDNVLVNGDGYWIRASDYSLFRDEHGKFHMFPSDMNEALQAPMFFGGGPGGFGGPRGGGFGPGGGPPGGSGGERPRGERPGGGGPGFRGPGGPRPGGGGGAELDPLVGLDDVSKPLRSRLLAVPSLKARYLEIVQKIARESLDPAELDPPIGDYRALIEPELAADTRKLSSVGEFQAALANPTDESAPQGRPGLRAFIAQRRKFLLDYAEGKNRPQPNEPQPAK